MTGKASADRRLKGEKPPEDSALTRFLQDWTELWRQELQAQSRDADWTIPNGMGFDRAALNAMLPEGIVPRTMMPAATELWTTAMALWADSLAAKPSDSSGHAAAPGAKAAAAAFEPRDAENERLARRVDELEARIAKLEAPRRRRG
jgi:hypothetical protein